VVEEVLLEIRVPGYGTVGVQHTQAVPGSSIDSILESTSVGPDGVHHTLLAWLRGFTPEQADAVVADLGKAYGGGASVVRRDPTGTVARYAVAVRDLQSPAVKAMAGFQRAMGAPWTRAAGGRMMFLAQARSREQGEEAAGRVRRYLGEHGIAAEVTLRAPTPEDAATKAHLVRLLHDLTWAVA